MTTEEKVDLLAKLLGYDLEAINEKNDEEILRRQRGHQFAHIEHGLYRIFWKEGGGSLAAVGSTQDGTRWFAPCNWTSGPSTDWDAVKRVELIASTKDQNYKR